MRTRNGADNATDRETGQHWENQFCRMAREHGKVFTPHQIGRDRKSAMFYGPEDVFGKSGWTLPDITIWSMPGEHHEIKHKRRTQDGMYGFERRRLDALIRFGNATGQKVYYTIHDWELAGGVDAHERVENSLDHWLVADIADLSKGCSKRTKGELTWYNGVLQPDVIWYWYADPGRRHRWFRPLSELWTVGARA